MKSSRITILLFFAFSMQLYAQQLLPPIEMFSTKKVGYLITSKDERIDFTMKDLDRKKGLIIRVKGVTADGKKIDFKADEVKELALPPSDFGSFSAAMDGSKSIVKAKKTNTKEFDRSLVYFYEEYLEDRKITALMQRLNPDFDSRIRIYHDPFAHETGGVSVMGIQATGGLDKSYYLKVDGKTKRYFKSDYDKDFKKLFGSCPKLIKKYKDFYWRNLQEHIFFFDQECE